MQGDIFTVADIVRPVGADSPISQAHRSLLVLWSVNGQRIATVPSTERYGGKRSSSRP